MDNEHLGSSEKLLLAAIDLISKKGYNGVTTLDIARAAGLSEKTLFRHFGTKLKLLEAALNRLDYAEEMKKLFKERLVWELEIDLLTICRTYHEIMNRNRKLVMISLKEADQLPEFKKRMHQHPLQLLEMLTNYFKEMGERGKMIPTNPELQAFTWIMAHFGAFINDLDAGINYPDIEMEPFLQESVKIFTKALTP
ncbi:TetR/AcrR family transcriptional regulator [Paenibacillus sp. Marseille-P2973]|uniref:TetR/AcrR family transcriptional regulator n=1 Tax=Paenibacillus sp. Marseille-P2973 TaxID=1871032 RepID=UPI001B38030B|nr:TetR/AcrR family transcriptional regulator [Paenibacillus sp. Marseille-P2973]MBQ4899095.1 TetR/AcrR family transcriptional regulator [Paenibacillus sp. Marseille-P2973]